MGWPACAVFIIMALTLEECGRCGSTLLHGRHIALQWPTDRLIKAFDVQPCSSHSVHLSPVIRLICLVFIQSVLLPLI